MSDQDAYMRGKRLAQARQMAGFHGPQEVINAYKSRGVTSSFYQHHNGSVGYSFKKAQLYGRLFGVRAEWLYSGDGDMLPDRASIPIAGDVAAGEAHFVDGYETGGKLGDLDMPRTEDRIALVVRGDSMAPLARDGDVAVFGPRRDDASPLINRRVMVRLRDGRHLFKILRPSQDAGRFTLYSVNAAYDPIESADVEWACPLEWLYIR